MNSISTALTGIQRAGAHFDNAAQNIAGSGSIDNNSDLAAQIVELTSAQNSVKLNVAVIRTQEEMDRHLLDIRA